MSGSIVIQDAKEQVLRPSTFETKFSVKPQQGLRIGSEFHGILGEFDVDGNGVLSVHEVASLAQKAIWFRNGFYLLTVVVLFMLGCTFGLTFLAIHLSKETKIQQNVLVTSEGDLVSVGVQYSHDIPLQYASLLDTEHLVRMESLTINAEYDTIYNTTFVGKILCFIAGISHEYPAKVQFWCQDGRRISVDSGYIDLITDDALNGSVSICGTASCNILPITTDETDYVKTLEEAAASYMTDMGSRRSLAKSCFRRRSLRESAADIGLKEVCEDFITRDKCSTNSMPQSININSTDTLQLWADSVVSHYCCQFHQSDGVADLVTIGEDFVTYCNQYTDILHADQYQDIPLLRLLSVYCPKKPSLTTSSYVASIGSLLFSQLWSWSGWDTPANTSQEGETCWSLPPTRMESSTTFTVLVLRTNFTGTWGHIVAFTGSLYNVNDNNFIAWGPAISEIDYESNHNELILGVNGKKESYLDMELDIVAGIEIDNVDGDLIESKWQDYESEGVYSLLEYNCADAVWESFSAVLECREGVSPPVALPRTVFTRLSELATARPLPEKEIKAMSATFKVMQQIQQRGDRFGLTH